MVHDLLSLTKEINKQTALRCLLENLKGTRALLESIEPGDTEDVIRRAWVQTHCINSGKEL